METLEEKSCQTDLSSLSVKEIAKGMFSMWPVDIQKSDEDFMEKDMERYSIMDR